VLLPKVLLNLQSQIGTDGAMALPIFPILLCKPTFITPGRLELHNVPIRLNVFGRGRFTQHLSSVPMDLPKEFPLFAKTTDESTNAGIMLSPSIQLNLKITNLSVNPVFSIKDPVNILIIPRRGATYISNTKGCQHTCV
jgi:hypothetical protein